MHDDHKGKGTGKEKGHDKGHGKGGPPMGYQEGPPPPGYQAGPPPGMYDPSMGQPQMMGGPPMTGAYSYDPQAQAEAEQWQLEEKQRARAEHDKEKEVRHLAKMVRSGTRDLSDSKGCANMLCIWGIMNALLWAVPLLGDQWFSKTWHGMSVDKLQLTLGLFNLHVDLQCKDTTSGDLKLCHDMQIYADKDGGNWAMGDLGDLMCKKDKRSCEIVGLMSKAGLVPLGGLPTAAAFEVLSVLLLFFYWGGHPTATIRSLGTKCAMLAPMIGTCSFCGYMALCPYLQELPRRWAAIGGHESFANSALFGLKETTSFGCGWCSLVYFFVMTSSMIRFFIQFTLAPNPAEPDSYVDESSRLHSDAEAMYDGTA